MGATQISGAAAESAAAALIERAGLEVITRNYRTKAGEIDLIARDGTTLVFIEVRKRANMRFGGAHASIDWRKQQRIVRAAQHYLLGFRTPPPCRFDAILVEGETVEWLRDAFQV